MDRALIIVLATFPEFFTSFSSLSFSEMHFLLECGRASNQETSNFFLGGGSAKILCDADRWNGMEWTGLIDW